MQALQSTPFTASSLNCQGNQLPALPQPSCRRCTLSALPNWATFLPDFANPRNRAAPGRPLADELLQLLSAAGSTADSRSRIDVLLTELQALQGLQFQEQLLGGGPWKVLYTKGTPQLWKATYSVGKLVRPSNAASQDLDPNSRRVVNRAEYLGDSLWVTASGTYQPLDDTPTLPKSVQANISSGCICLFGLQVPLPIRGTGYFDVLYLDERLRVFSSGGALAVQVKESYLEQQGVL